MKKSTIIGISGGSGSGKTSFIKTLKSIFNKEELCVISQDDYYRPRIEQYTDENGVQNFDLPSAIDLEAFVRDIQTVQNGTPVTRAEYTFNNELANSATITFHPAPVILVEGLFVFHSKEIFSLMDLSILIHAKDSDKIIRRILRDQKERNYPIDDVLYRYKHHVIPAFEKFIAPFIEEVDIVVNNNTNFDNAVKVITSFIRQVNNES